MRSMLRAVKLDEDPARLGVEDARRMVIAYHEPEAAVRGRGATVDGPGESMLGYDGVGCGVDDASGFVVGGAYESRDAGAAGWGDVDVVC